MLAYPPQVSRLSAFKIIYYYKNLIASCLEQALKDAEVVKTDASFFVQKR